MKRVIQNEDKKIFSECFLFTGMDTSLTGKIFDRFYGVADGIEGFDFERYENAVHPHFSDPCLGIIVSGAAAVRSGESNRALLNTLFPGAVFGAAAVFSDDFPLTIITALQKTRVLFISRKSLEAIMQEQPSVAFNYIGFLSGRICFLNRKITTYTASSAEERLMEYLFSLRTDSEVSIVLPMSINRLSEWLSIGRATLYRAFDSLEKSGLIKKNGRTVIFTENGR